jgi:hypothetical protein
MADRVFLCHSSEDEEQVRDLYRHLQRDGLEPWQAEEDILPGQDWDGEIRRAIQESRCVLVCLSKSSVTKRGYVQKEIKHALDVAHEQPEGAIFLIPVRLEPCQVPERLGSRQRVDLFAAGGYERLLLSLRRDRSPGAPDPTPTQRAAPVPRTSPPVAEPASPGRRVDMWNLSTVAVTEARLPAGVSIQLARSGSDIVAIVDPEKLSGLPVQLVQFLEWIRP